MPNNRPNIRLNLPANSSSRSVTATASRELSGVEGGVNSECVKPGMFIMKMPNSATPRNTSSASMRSAAGSGACCFGAASASTFTGRRYQMRRAVKTTRCHERPHPMFHTAIAGSLPKPSWLAETEKLWPEWKASGAELERAKADATLLWLKVQEDAGLDIVGDGEQSRQHFVHGFLARVEGIDFEHKVKMGIRNNRYDAMVPQVIGRLRLAGRVHAAEAQLARAHTDKPLKFTLPGPMTIVDTVADRFYGEGKEGRIKLAFAFAELLNQEALALQADGVDIVQFDEPAFNVYMADAAEWGVAALERAAQGLSCTTAVHICYGYGIKANVDWKATLGEQWRQYEQVFPALAKSSIDQVSLECFHSHVPPELMRLLAGKDVMVGVIDVASDVIETPEEIAETIGRVLQFVPKERLIACTNCGLAPMRREVAEAKLAALAQGAARARRRYA